MAGPDKPVIPGQRCFELVSSHAGNTHNLSDTLTSNQKLTSTYVHVFYIYMDMYVQYASKKLNKSTVNSNGTFVEFFFTQL